MGSGQLRIHTMAYKHIYTQLCYIADTSSFLKKDGIADLKPDYSLKLQLIFVSCLIASSESKLLFDKPSLLITVLFKEFS